MKTRGANQSRYVSAMVNNQVPINANQNDLLAMQNLIRGDQEHLQRIFNGRKLYGPMTEAEQIDALQYAFGLRGIIRKEKS